ETAFEDAVLLKSGCICCTVRGDLVDTLDVLWGRRRRGEIPPFARVVIETTGLAEPGPILRTLMTDAGIAEHYRLDGIVSTVDAVNGDSQLDRQPESVQQAAMADRLVLTKSDLADATTIERLTARLKELNPAAPLFRAVNGEIDAARLLDAGLYDPTRHQADLQRWLNEGAYGDEDHHHHDANRHGSDIRAFCITRDTPLDWPKLRAWLEALTSLRGADLLRLKGVINVAGARGPVVLHGVQHVFHPPTQLKAWPAGDDRRTRLVFIVRNIEKAAVERSLDAALV
ncbi:MAG: GTP-binding protein, partial [Alphaproteobacteria bacterium]|nr:GTP-binding protein [Alphaproteobacteria bacterium]